MTFIAIFLNVILQAMVFVLLVAVGGIDVQLEWGGELIQPNSTRCCVRVDDDNVWSLTCYHYTGRDRTTIDVVHRDVTKTVVPFLLLSVITLVI